MKESGLMFMGNINNLKRSVRKLAAAMLSVVTAVTLMPVQAVQGKGTSHLALGVADINTLNVSLSVSASVQRALDAGLKNNSGRADVIRAVLDDIEELPQYGNTDFTSITRGTAERPFVILEIAPAEECGELGYLVSGCEPIRMEDMFGFGEYTRIAQTLTTGYLTDVPSGTFFFMDEPEGNASNYGSYRGNLQNWAWRINQYGGQSFVHRGYYEYVGTGKGCFSVEAGKMVKKGADSGEYIWHTVNSFEASQYEGIEFNDDIADAAAKVGERIYTTRTSYNAKLDGSDSMMMVDQVVEVSGMYKVYTNKENFLKDTLLLDDETAAGYSCVIKTITAQELNRTPEWVDYSDLIYIFPGNHNTEIVSAWKQTINGAPANRLGHTSATTNYPINTFEINDISADVTMKIFNRVSASENYASIIIDNRLFDFSQNTLTSLSTVNNVNMDIFDWSFKDTGKDYQATASSNNVYKLSVMLMSMNPNFFKQLYLQPGNELVKIVNGELVDTLQRSPADKCWSGYTFQLMEKDYSGNLYNYFTSSENWFLYGSCSNLSEQKYKTYVDNHIFTFNGNSCVTMQFVNEAGGLGSDKQLQDGRYLFGNFRDYLDENADTFQYNADKADSSDAVRYILGIGSKKQYYGENTTLRILDLEPSVGLDSASKPEWTRTENYIRRLIPDFQGNIEVTHMTTAEYIGKVDDINSDYDLVYIGLDAGGYNVKTNAQAFFNDGSSTWGNTITDFNDDSLDGKIYFHLGDRMVSTCYDGGGRNRSVRFIYNNAGTGVVSSEELRFAGNDITNIKKNELISFIASGKPVVAEKYLYDLERFFIDTGSNLYSLVNSYRNTETEIKGIYLYSDTRRLQDTLRNKAEAVIFTSIPALYNGTTVSDTNPTISNPNYLPVNGEGDAYMTFEFTVPGEGYNYRIYVDQDRDSKFSSGEIVQEGTAAYNDGNRGVNTCIYEVASSIVGIVQWKIEVYRNDNVNVRYTRTGSSAAKLRSDTERKKLNVLQIMPKNDSGLLNLEKNDLFRKRYSNLNDFDVTVRTITWSDFEKFFAGEGFEFDLSQDISSTNPETGVLASVSDELDKSGREIRSELDGRSIGKLSSYNMIIVGFGDIYGAVDLSNTNGAVEYLQYYTKLGKSILYTHDITSLYNLKQNGNKTFGYTANAMLRDIMGMNRYKAVSTELASLASGDRLKNAVTGYQSGLSYDEISSDQKQGFTYYAMKRLGWTKKQTDWNNPNKTGNSYNRLPYRYMITNPQGNAVVNENSVSSSTGFANNNDLTTTATKVNEGQITTYPYKISDVLSIAPTHGQWYQLNMEDKEVTVWYCLSDPVASGNAGIGSARSSSSTGNGDGSALTYGVSPNDAANNYYIYSKGNVFYSGVGHSWVSGDMEAKLFVNTMIAAYRISYDAPTVKIEKADMTSGVGAGQSSVYDLSIDKNNAKDYSADVPDEYADYVRIYFRPEDMSFSNDMDVRISYAKKDGSMGYITEIWTGEAQGAEAAGTVHTADDTDKFFAGLNNNGLYYFYYRKSDIRTVSSTFTFEVNNNRSAEVGLAYMKLNLQSLYYLD